MDTLNEERKKWDNERKQLIDEHNTKIRNNIQKHDSDNLKIDKTH